MTKTWMPEQYTGALESWHWLDLNHRTPRFSSLFGDVFFEAGDGGWFLDSLEGSLSREWDDREHMQAALSTAEGQDRYLLAGLAHAAHERGIALSRDQVYDFTTPPILGGEIVVDNVSAMDFVVSLNIAGQLHDQIRGLPPGTPSRDSPSPTSVRREAALTCASVREYTSKVDPGNPW
jgi:hypothetical protein